MHLTGMPYVKVATAMVRTLLNLSEGVQFLRTDRRGKLCAQIRDALVHELARKISLRS